MASTSAAPPIARTYDGAIDALNSLQSNAATIEAMRKLGGKMNDFLLPEMVEYLQRIGYQSADLNRLKVVHVTGTKGKGSTCAFVDSLFRQLTPSNPTPVKVGLYTSPHMTSVRERIRINSLPISQTLFTKYFWETWDRFEQNSDRRMSHTPLRPVYFRFLTVLAFHIFLSEKVDTVILEVGIGGKYDSTNIVPLPAVAGIAQLGLDHTALLGNTVEEIAAQKAGIFKPNASAVCWSQQPGNAVETVRTIAQEKQVSNLTLVDLHAALQPRPISAAQDADTRPAVQLGLPGVHQRTNASLALELVNTFLENTSLFAEKPHREATLASWQRVGLEAARWPGRCQTVPSSVPDLPLTWYLDGAHTTDSLTVCLEWFTSLQLQRPSGKTRILVFNCTNGRSAHELLSSILRTIQHRLSTSDEPVRPSDFFDHVIFTTNITFDSSSGSGWSSELASNAIDPADLTNLVVQKQLAETWAQLVPPTDASKTQIHITASIQAMHTMVTSMAAAQTQGVECLVTGSLHLVGGVMAHLQKSGCLDQALVSTRQT